MIADWQNIDHVSLKVQWWDRSSCWMDDSGCVRLQPASVSSAVSCLWWPSRLSESTVTCTSAGTPLITQHSLGVVPSSPWFRRGWPVLPSTHQTISAGRRTGSIPWLRSACGTAPPHTTTPSSSSSSACCCRLSSPSSVTGESSLIFNLPSNAFSEYSFRQSSTLIYLVVTH